METLFTKLRSLIGLPISIVINSSVSLNGSVVEIKPDHLYLMNTNGLLQYVKISGIKEIVKNSKENKKIKSPLFENPISTKENFRDLLQSLNGQLLLVSRIHMDNLTGVLCDVSEDMAVFVDNEKLIFVPIQNIEYVQDQLLDEGKDNSKEKSNGQESKSHEKNQAKQSSDEKSNGKLNGEAPTEESEIDATEDQIEEVNDFKEEPIEEEEPFDEERIETLNEVEVAQEPLTSIERNEEPEVEVNDTNEEKYNEESDQGLLSGLQDSLPICPLETKKDEQKLVNTPKVKQNKTQITSLFDELFEAILQRKANNSLFNS